MSTDTIKILYEGSKNLWKIRVNIEMVIVEYLPLQCVELISFNPSIGLICYSYC